MIEIIVLLAVILYAITVHEFSHAATADMLGDPTPRMAGRLSLNPLSHIDPIGFIMLILVRFGWAKPVPINPYNFRDPVRGEVLVSLAGPLSNFISAWVCATIVRFLPADIVMNGYVQLVLSNFIFINLALGVFNLIPVPPLDGSHLIEPFLPYEVRESLQQYGFFILIFILIFPPTSLLLMQIIRLIYNFIT